MSRLAQFFVVLSMALVMAFPRLALAEEIVEKPSAAAMAGDLVIARPILLGMTVLGTAAYVVSLPFTLAGGNAAEAADTLMIGPAKATFVRCLGCTKSGRKPQTVEAAE